MRSAILLAGALLLASCGQREPQTPAAAPDTPFGTVAEVREYLDQIGPYVQEIGDLQASVEQALSSVQRQGDVRRGTGRNLSAAAEAVQPRMQQILDEFGQITPPALLAPFHRDTEKLVLLRLEAYRLLAEGWQAEEAGGDFEATYNRAETKLREANEAIRGLNNQMAQINGALEAVSPPAAEAAR